MKNFGWKLCFIAIFGSILFSNQIFAQGLINEQYESRKVFKNVAGDKFYLQGEVVHVNSEGIYLCIDGEMIPVPSIQADEDGVYLEGSAWPRCPVCGFPLSPWGTCLNTLCPTKG